MPRQVMVVDDDSDVLSTMAKLLRTWGYEPVPFATFEDAREFLEDRVPDAMVVDVRLGKYNGLQLLHLARQTVPNFARLTGRVKQKNGAGCGVLEHVDLIDELKLMAGDKARALDEISRANRTRARPQMRNRDCSGFLGVVNEVALHELSSFMPDDLDGVLVRTDGAVSAETVEQCSRNVVGLGSDAEPQSGPTARATRTAARRIAQAGPGDGYQAGRLPHDRPGALAAVPYSC